MVTDQWERPAGRVRWIDGPTRQVMMDRAAALGRYRVGAALPVEQLRFTRSDSAVAVALAWLAHRSPPSPAHTAEAGSVVEALCAGTGYPETRFAEATLGAAGLLTRLGHGTAGEMGTLLARAAPIIPPHTTMAAGPDLPGRVSSIRWPAGGPPDDLLGPSSTAPRSRHHVPRRRLSTLRPAAARTPTTTRPTGEVLQRNLPHRGPPRAPQTTGG
jgi:hypothetical protein